MSGPPDISLNVLVASADPAILDVAQRALVATGDKPTSAMSVAEALATAQAERYDVAFVDVSLDGDTGLALVHHLRTLVAGLVVYVLASPKKVELATEGVSLGAAGILVTPLTGDALAQAAGEVRVRNVDAQRRHDLEVELLRMRRRSDLLDRLIRLARGSGQSEAVRVITDAFAQATQAKGVVLYAAFEAPGGDCVRLATSGTARDMPAIARLDELAKTFELRKARPVSLKTSHGLIGIVAIEGGIADVETEHATLVELATVVLALMDSRRPRGQAMKDERGAVYSGAYFQDIAAREIDKAKRHGRRVSICAIALDGSDRVTKDELENVVRQVVRDTDVLASETPNEYLLLMPETGGLGAHACRRRIFTRIEGDRRQRSSNALSDRRGPVPSRRGAPVTIGSATYPHDGVALERLVRIAKNRASAQARSAVHTLSLAQLALPEAVDMLLAKPILDSGVTSPFPLELASHAFLSLVGQACLEARRGGGATIYVTVHPSMGVASAVRQAVRDAKDITVRAVDARGVPGCGDVEAVVVAAEHGHWVCCGRVTKDRFRGVHAADPLLADLVAHRLAQAGGLRGP